MPFDMDLQVNPISPLFGAKPLFKTVLVVLIGSMGMYLNGTWIKTQQFSQNTFKLAAIFVSHNVLLTFYYVSSHIMN